MFGTVSVNECEWKHSCAIQVRMSGTPSKNFVTRFGKIKNAFLFT